MKRHLQRGMLVYDVRNTQLARGHTAEIRRAKPVQVGNISLLLTQKAGDRQ